MKFSNQDKSLDLFVFDDVDSCIISLETTDKLVWVTHEIPNRKGDIKHFMGSGDGDILLTGKLLGLQTSKSDNKTILRNLAIAGTIIYFDTEGYESALDGHYVITEISIPETGGEPWEFTLTLSQFNN
jgi:phage protein U